MIALLLGSMVFYLYGKTSGPAANLLSEVWKEQWDVLCCMPSSYLFLETCPTKQQAWNCMFLLCYQFFGWPFGAQNLSNVYCDETRFWISMLSVFQNKFKHGELVSLIFNSIYVHASPTSGPKFPLCQSGKPFDFFDPPVQQASHPTQGYVVGAASKRQSGN